MNIFNDPLILVTIVITVFIFLRLRSVLGKRTGHQPPQDAREAQRRRETHDEGPDNVVALPRRGAGPEVQTKPASKVDTAIDAMAPAGTKLNRQLKDIAAADPSFDPTTFLEGARMAYEMIVTAFADGDRKSLRNLLSREVYEGFSTAIADRESRGEQVRSTFVGVDSTKIVGGELVRSDAHVTVRFVSQIISATYDTAGKVIDGDPDQVAEVTDVWTFARDTRSRDPNWKLVATESES
jgi:predicted lipid-binding transport protein (Tim44 family)